MKTETLFIGTLSFLMTRVCLADSPFVFADREQFIGATRAEIVSAPYQAGNVGSNSVTSGAIIIDPSANSGLFFNDWSADFEGDNDVELALNGDEKFSIIHSNGPVHAMGIDFDRGQGTTFATRSTFTITLLNGSIPISNFFLPASSPEETFIGVWSAVAFDRLRIEETEVVNGNEYFGSVFVGNTPPSPLQQKLVASDDQGGLRFGTSA